MRSVVCKRASEGASQPMCVCARATACAHARAQVSAAPVNRLRRRDEPPPPRTGPLVISRPLCLSRPFCRRLMFPRPAAGAALAVTRRAPPHSDATPTTRAVARGCRIAFTVGGGGGGGELGVERGCSAGVAAGAGQGRAQACRKLPARRVGGVDGMGGGGMKGRPVGIEGRGRTAAATR